MIRKLAVITLVLVLILSLVPMSVQAAEDKLYEKTTGTAATPIQAPQALKPAPAVSTAPASTEASGFPVKGKPTENNIVGVWVHTQANLLGTLSGMMSKHYYVFYPDGRFMWGMPDGGLYNFDFEERKNGYKVSEDTPDYGTYSFKGGKGHVRGNNGVTLEITMDSRYGSLNIGNYKGFMFIPSLDGMKLDGLFTQLTPNLNGVIPEKEVQENPETFLHLYKNGTFDDKKGIFRWEPGNYPTTDEFFPTDEEREKLVHPGKGAYEIKDFSLILHYEDGLTTKHRILLDVIEMSSLDYSKGVISPKHIYIRREAHRSDLMHFQ